MAGSKKDFTEGRLFMPMILFALPIMATGVLQMLYNAADKVVVGQFSGNATALGAISSTGSLSTLLTAVALGLSTGSGVAIARRFGAKDDASLRRAVHTVFSVGLFMGCLLGLCGFFLAEPLLRLISTNVDLFADASKYLRIICLGLPASILYNFGASVQRSVGNARAPLVILGVSGLLNVLLNIVFVVVLHMTVDGVAFATIISQYASALTVWVLLAKRRDAVRFQPRAICVDRTVLAEIVRIGLPSGIQASLASVSGVLVQRGVNIFPKEVITGISVAGSVEGFAYVAMEAFHQAQITVTGQNVGAKKPDRVRKTLIYGLIQAVTAGLVVGYLCFFFSDSLTSLFVDTSLPEASAILNAAWQHNCIVLTTYFFLGINNIFVSHLRGRGCSVPPMIVSILCTCVMRCVWVLGVFLPFLPHTIFNLYVCWPFAWVLGSCFHGLTLWRLNRRERERGAKVEE